MSKPTGQERRTASGCCELGVGCKYPDICPDAPNRSVLEKEKAFGDGFDAGQNEALSYIGPMLDDWDRLSNDAPLFVQKLKQLRQTIDRT